MIKTKEVGKVGKNKENDKSSNDQDQYNIARDQIESSNITFQVVIFQITKT